MTERNREHTPPNIDRYRNDFFGEVFGENAPENEDDVWNIIDKLLSRWEDEGKQRAESEELAERRLLLDYVGAKRKLSPESNAWILLERFLLGRE